MTTFDDVPLCPGGLNGVTDDVDERSLNTEAVHDNVDRISGMVKRQIGTCLTFPSFRIYPLIPHFLLSLAFIFSRNLLAQTNSVQV